MDELPAGMLTGSRPVDPDFSPDERLFRRIPPDLWSEPPYAMELDAVDAVNMSVNRSKYGPPEWVRLGNCADCGVVFFVVSRLPTCQSHNGQEYAVRPEHVPLARNYPHSEI